MVSVYIRRRKKVVIFYTRRRRGFGEQELSSLLSSNDVYSLKEEVQNNGVFSSVNDLVDIGLSDGLPAPCISEKNQGNSEVEFERDETVIKRNLFDDFDLSTEGSLHEEVTKANKPVDIGLDNNEPLLSVIQEFPSTLCFQRRPRSARKYGGLPRLVNNEPLLSVIKQLPLAKCLQRRPRSTRKSTLLASRRQNIIECGTSDNLEQIASHIGASLSSCFEISPKTPIKDDRISKFTPDSLLCDVQDLLSTGVFAGALVKYKKDNVELLGVVSTSGICCGCSLCKFEQVVSSLKFEKHAGSKSHNQNAHIFLENGMSLYALSKVLKNVSLGSLAEVIEENFGYLQANKAVNMAWKGVLNRCEAMHFPPSRPHLMRFASKRSNCSFKTTQPPAHFFKTTVSSGWDKYSYSHRRSQSPHPLTHDQNPLNLYSTPVDYNPKPHKRLRRSKSDRAPHTRDRPMQTPVLSVLADNLRPAHFRRPSRLRCLSSVSTRTTQSVLPSQPSRAQDFVRLLVPPAPLV